ncbi:DegT/DnrJ/EryC1/StrS family aminotransferase [Caldilinea sp.]|uniref:DegT/DnrJ/EryC1/StrS family aminotransferase n=1 Tax=Caldilinea sp. TaxID=2293560 RepID=UPI002BD5915A|nr:DegT/DnrJ/EryC1/StrS family aminotransferase [Caldilinea sp.]
MNIPFNELRSGYLAYQTEIDAAVHRVLESGWYILGRETTAFEEEFAAYCGAAGCVGVNSGTDALYLALRACGVGPGDEVITVSHTAVATVAAIRMSGATPVLVDIDPDTYTMSPNALADAMSPTTRAVLPVHLYGHAADMAAICEIAETCFVIEDCAQAHGARYQGRPVGSFGDLACYSFYPTKNLGALGDGGAVTGNDAALLGKVRLLREYGWTPQERYVSHVEGVNSRLDEMQAAILRVRLRHLDADNEARRRLASLYSDLLPDLLKKPVEREHCRHVYHLYVVQYSERDRLRAQLAAQGIGAGIHYPTPVHLQPAYQAGQVRATALPVTEQAAREVLSLPLHPTLGEAQARTVVQAVAAALQ